MIGTLAPATHDATAKTTGVARYLADGIAPARLAAGFLRSPVARAEQLRVDIAPALAVPGVVAAVSADDFAPADGTPALARGEIHYLGEPLAAVAAESDAALEAGLAAIVAAWHAAPAVEQMGDGQPAATHACGRGDADVELQASGVVLDAAYTIPARHTPALEPAGAVAVPHGAGGVTIYSPDLHPLGLRIRLATTLDMPSEQIRVLSPTIGGYAGNDSDILFQCAASAARLALQCGRPVQLVASAQETASFGPHSSAMSARYRLGADADGSLRAAAIEVWADIGPFGQSAGRRAARHAAGPYRWPASRVALTEIHTNNGLVGLGRGAGVLEIAAAGEQAMDELAERCGIDPLELRLKNCLVAGDAMPFGQSLDASVGLRRCLEQVATWSGWAQKRPAYAAQPATSVVRRGIGIAACCYGNGLDDGLADHAGCRIVLEPEGVFQISVGAPEYGQGLHAMLRRLAGETLGFPSELFHLRQPDSDSASEAGPLLGARAAVALGHATLLAARKLRAALWTAAAAVLDCDVASISWDGGHFCAPAGRHADLTQLCAAAGDLGLPLSATARWDAPRQTGYAAYTFGAQVAEVEVDLLAGATRLLGLWGVFDVGRVLHAQGALAQAYGGMAFGAGYALSSDAQQTLHAGDLPPMRVEFVEEAWPSGPLGAKGLSDATPLATAPAILNAIAQAAGRRIRHLPATPARLTLGAPLADTPLTLVNAAGVEQARPITAGPTPAPATTITVSVRYQGRLAYQTGRATEAAYLPAGARLGDLQALLWELHPALREYMSQADGAPIGNVHWFLDGRAASFDAPLSAGVRVTLLPLAGGG